MTDKQYYREKGISSTSLKWFEYSPKYFRKRLDEEIVDEKKSWLELGRKVHMSILEPEEFEKNYIYLEYTQPKSPNQKQFCEEYVADRKKNPKATKISSKIKAYKKSYNADKKQDDVIKTEATKLYNRLKDYIEYLEKSEEYKDILTKSDWDKIKELKDTVFEHKIAADLMALNKDPFDTDIITYSEIPIFWKYPVKYEDVEIDCKSMLDRLVIDKKNKIIRLIDIKTTSNIGEFKDSFEKYKYYRQLSFYWMALIYELKEGSLKDTIDNLDEYDKESYIVVLQTRDLPECRVYQIEESQLNEGLTEIENIIPKIAWHFRNNLWEHTKDYYEGNGIEKLY